ncbi:WhiB family transcriptional regulator [Streptomyces pseudogriseolus]|uniref:WhiB family transcriptional regulator n=1 Tax=Streptomyces pseudogriseolus TaxID=36817 RepID=UPI003FA1F058
MTTTNTTTRRPARPAAHDWRTSAACQGVDIETLYSDKPTEQHTVQRICGYCPVRVTCLRDALGYEASTYQVFGVAGGLLDWQRKALIVHAQLGERPNVQQARVLSSRVFAGFMQEWLDWPAETVAAELRAFGVLASPVTVRLALWWCGGRGSVLAPLPEGDRRVQWMQVRDECRPVVEMLRGHGLSNRDIVAFLGVAFHNFERAVRWWRSADAAVQDSPAQQQELGVAA